MHDICVNYNALALPSRSTQRFSASHVMNSRSVSLQVRACLRSDLSTARISPEQPGLHIYGSQEAARHLVVNNWYLFCKFPAPMNHRQGYSVMGSNISVDDSLLSGDRHEDVDENLRCRGNIRLLDLLAASPGSKLVEYL